MIQLTPLSAQRESSLRLSHNAPRFGWRKDTLPKAAYEYPIQVGKDIFKAEDGSLEPTPELAKHIATRLKQTALNAPRFVFIPNLADIGATLGGSLEQLRVFQDKLFRAVCANSASADNSEKTRYRIHHVVRGDGQEQRLDNGQRVDRLWTLKSMHQDANADFFSHLYGPIENVSGGAFKILDYQQLMKDKGLRFDEVFDVVTQEGKADTQPVLKQSLSTAAEAYTMTLPLTPPMPGPAQGTASTYPLLFMNNKTLAHGVEPVTITASNFSRVFSRLSATIVER